MPGEQEMMARIRNAIWREDHYDPKLCGCDNGCPYCEPHDDLTPDHWPTDKERAERQAQAAYTLFQERERELVEALREIRDAIESEREDGVVVEGIERIVDAALTPLKQREGGHG